MPTTHMSPMCWAQARGAPPLTWSVSKAGVQSGILFGVVESRFWVPWGFVECLKVSSSSLKFLRVPQG